ncbi:MAG TPA: signal peptidase I [Pyrinomonadaceae bacterium]|nr:signal peptidase I [Pyrinomonadaceae bacterium]
MALVLLAGVVMVAGCSEALNLSPVRLEGDSMQPTLNDGDRCLISKNVNDLKRGDIVIFRYPQDQSRKYIQRIIGMPGEEVEIRSGKVLINGTTLDEDYLDDKYNQSAPSFPPKKMGTNQYFVMGDNRDNSFDSRYWGGLDAALIEGRLYLEYGSGN